MSTRVVVIVDPYSSGGGLAPAFRRRGVRAVAVLTTREVPGIAMPTWEPSHFDHVLDATVPRAELLERLAGLAPSRILPGSESGVRVADELTRELLPGVGNVAGSAAARHDKWHTSIAVARAGLPVLAQLATSDPGELARWRADRGLDAAPIVLKPVNSAGADSVHLVEGGRDCRPVAEGILGGRNRMGRRDEVILAQEYARGVEYAVDTYSSDGRHAVVMVSRYRKRMVGDRLGVYEAVRCLAPDEARVAEIVEYVRGVLDAVGLREGCAHVEVMDTPAGPRLIEVNARIAGNPLPEITRLATGDSQIDRCVRHVVDGEVGSAGYRLDRHATAVFLSSPATGTLENAEELSALADLPTCVGVRLAAGSGQRVERTRDVFTSLGQVLLVGEDAARVEADHAAVRAAETRVRVTAARPAVVAGSA